MIENTLAGASRPISSVEPKTIEATIGYIEAQWYEVGYANDRKTYDVMGDEATSLVVNQSGTRRADEVVLLAAHYDSVFNASGADDNASAVTVMLEVSRLLREHRGKRTARYVAFACEEPPCFNRDSMGSQHHARTSRERGDNIVGMLCLEMVGFLRITKGSQPIPPGITTWMHRFFPDRGM